MSARQERTCDAILTEAGETIRRVRETLENPAHRPLEESGQELAAALALLGALPEALAQEPPAGREVLRAKARRSRQELARVRVLLDSADAFYAGWARRRAGLAAGYTPQGIPTEPPSMHRLSLAG